MPLSFTYDVVLLCRRSHITSSSSVGADAGGAAALPDGAPGGAGRLRDAPQGAAAEARAGPDSQAAGGILESLKGG